jgi:Skp family chaperone for outer membrane proteins
VDETDLEEKFKQVEMEWEKQQEKYERIAKKLKTYQDEQ